jgi:hypothetical protein
LTEKAFHNLHISVSKITNHEKETNNTVLAAAEFLWPAAEFLWPAAEFLWQHDAHFHSTSGSTQRLSTSISTVGGQIASSNFAHYKEINNNDNN